MRALRLILFAFIAASCVAQTPALKNAVGAKLATANVPAPATSAPKAAPAAAPTVEKTSAPVPDATAIKPLLPPVEVVDTSKYRMRRDPFVNPIVQQRAASSSACATGKRCLVIGQITLKGIIISPEGMLAIIENGANRTYFLHVNDPLFDGMVERITRDSITFRENVSDSLGRPLGTREVVKKIVAPAA
jgi:Tfp pilus assembly protein PilP